MALLLRNNWPWTLLAFLIGAIVTWFLLTRREPPLPAEVPAEEEELAEEKVLVGAGVGAAGTPPAPAERAFEQSESGERPEHSEHSEPGEPEPLPEPEPEPSPAFSQRMDDAEPTLFDQMEPEPADVQVKSAPVPPGRYGEGSAEAVAHQGPPDGFTIKGNAQSMLFHTPDSPYYGRTKPEVWFRTEADAERAGFTKYVRKPRKSPNAGK